MKPTGPKEPALSTSVSSFSSSSTPSSSSSSSRLELCESPWGLAACMSIPFLSASVSGDVRAACSLALRLLFHFIRLFWNQILTWWKKTGERNVEKSQLDPCWIRVGNYYHLKYTLRAFFLSGNKGVPNCTWWNMVNKLWFWCLTDFSHLQTKS